jgi:hypothetical protein
VLVDEFGEQGADAGVDVVADPACRGGALPGGVVDGPS